jgi:hypothetical protein
MSEYETLKAEYENFKTRLSKLEMLREQARNAWSDAGYHDKKTYKELCAADKNFQDMRKSGRALVYKVAVLEHKEFGTSLNKLFKEYGITTVTMKKLLREAGVAYLRPTLGQWLPIGTAPKDGTVVLGFANNEDGTVFLSEIMWCKKNETIIGVTGNEAGPNQWFSLLLSGSVRPTHWMPLPKPPKLG